MLYLTPPACLRRTILCLNRWCPGQADDAIEVEMHAWVEAVHTGTQAAGPAPPQFPPPALCGGRRRATRLDPPGNG